MSTPNPKTAPGIDRTATRTRLAQFEQWTGTRAPDPPFDELTDEFLRYCYRNSLSLDWVYLGDPRGPIMDAHKRAKGAQGSEAPVIE